MRLWRRRRRAIVSFDLDAYCREAAARYNHKCALHPDWKLLTAGIHSPAGQPVGWRYFPKPGRV